ncbi:MAG: hypothetical protein ACLPVO_02565 [Desulfomonilaceae bacterium]
MKTEYSETARFDPNCEIRVGRSSWDPNDTSMKYAWKGKNGKVTRGGEFPIETVEQMSEVAIAIKRGYVTLDK